RNAYGVVRLSEAAGPIALTAGGGDFQPAPPQAADRVLPPRYRDLLAKLPALAALAGGSESQRLAGLQAWFADNFRYTLNLGEAGQERRDLERFLFVDRAGHCEYFASATVLLLRGLGIPARYVTGYSVQEFSTLERAFVVRQRHAHAWAEAFVDGRWVELDTTPAEWLTVEEQQAPFWQPAADLLSYAWQHIGEWRQDLGDDDVNGNLIALATLLLVIPGVLVGRRLWHRLRQRRPSDAASSIVDASVESRHLRQLEARCAALGLPRPAGEPPRRWLRRIADEGASVLTADDLARAEITVAAFYRQRYGGGA
ncbi:transglutaminase domain-containing protein, partial [bacterium]|nr:transglutaminase domain-containing protein [bacterium]